MNVKEIIIWVPSEILLEEQQRGDLEERAICLIWLK